MTTTALALYCVYFLLALVLRAVVQRRHTGSWGVRGISHRAGLADQLGGVLLVGGCVGLAVGPFAERHGWIAPIAVSHPTVVAGAGVVLYLLGLTATLAAQFGMGASWRIGVDQREHTALVTHGPFRRVRNPIFTAMIVTAVGLFLLAPSVATGLSVAAIVVGLELHVRYVEEPYLLQAHGGSYLAYAQRAGRFVPGIGRLKGVGA